MSDLLPPHLNGLARDLETASGRLDAFKAGIHLLSAAYKALEKIRRSVRQAEKELAEMRDNHTFFMRHGAKVEALLRAMAETYSRPAKAMRTLDQLAENYPAQYVYDVCRIGSSRLAAPNGFSMLGFRSAQRMFADENYEKAILPMLIDVLPLHGDYVRIRREGVEQAYEDAMKVAGSRRAELAAIEAALPGWSEKLSVAAGALSAAEVEQLNVEERKVRGEMMGRTGGTPS